MIDAFVDGFMITMYWIPGFLGFLVAIAVFVLVLAFIFNIVSRGRRDSS